MVKVALLIGVSEYGPDLNPLPGAIKDVEAVKQAFPPLEMGGFDEVKPLLNPNPPVMREAIETLFSGRTKDDLVLLFFSGHVVQDDQGKSYFATCITSKSPKAEHIRVSTIPTSFVDNLMSNSSCQHQVVILDCCLNRLSTQDLAANDDGITDIKIQLGGEGRAILTSFTSTENSFKLDSSRQSVYTRYLVEGIRTGAADLDSDGWISVDELHQYTRNKLQVVAPAMKPAFYSVEDRQKILLFNAPIDDPKLKYRKQVETCVCQGEISESGRHTLNKLAESFQLSFQEVSVIEAEVLKPYREYQENLQKYKHKFAKVISKTSPLGTQEREELREFQQSLRLRDEDISPIEERITSKLINLSRFEDHADELTQSDSDSEPNSVSSMPNIVISESTLIPPLAPTNLTPVSEDGANQLAPSDSQSEPNSVLPEATLIPAPAPTDTNPAVDLSLSVLGLPTSPSPSSTFPKKLLLTVGIGGALVALAVAIGLSSRTQVTPPVTQVNRVSSSPNSSLKLSPTPFPTAQSFNKEPSPSPSESPDSKDCLVFVNGNLRSEPTPLRNNVVESLKKPVPVTGKRTTGGWLQVKMTNGRLGWAHPEIISSEGEKEMETCLAKKGITIKTIEDIPSP